MFKNICLIGLPYSGKSRLGRLISQNANKGFIEVDNIIKNVSHTKLSNIIRTQGIDNFLKLENNIGKTIDCQNTVISPGGSMIYNKEAMNHIKLNLDCDIIHLYLTLPEFKKRITNIEERGIVNPYNLSIEELYMERIRLCENYTDYTILSDNKADAYINIMKILNSKQEIKKLRK
jgi:shikimate kinase